MNGLMIGKLIYQTLSQSSEVQRYVERDAIFPLVATETTKFPFVVYNRNNAYDAVHSKDGWLIDEISFVITVVSDKYFESIELANIIRGLFENQTIETEDISVENMRMTASNESFSDNAYIQNLYFQCNETE